MHLSPIQNLPIRPSLSTLCWTCAAMLVVSAGWLAMADMLRMGILSFDIGAMGPGTTAIIDLVLRIEGIPPGLWDSLCQAKTGASLSWGEWAMACRMGAIMILAMMLPCATPAWVALRSGGPPWPAVVFMLGYASPWTLFSLALATADTVVQHLVGNHLVSTGGTAGIAAAAALSLAGIYQLTGMKRRARASLRQPPKLFKTGRPDRDALGKGMRYGICCLKSNGPLMSTMIVLGMMNMVAMIVLTAVMIIDKKVAHHRATATTGVAIVLAGCGFALADLAN